MTELDDQDFATLFAASERTARFETGAPVHGTVVALGADVAFVDIGGKSEATIALSELRDEDGALEVAVGDRLDATVMSTAGGVTLSRKLQRRAASMQQIEAAFRAGLPVEGKVEGPTKGGFLVSIARQRAFCPASQMDLTRDVDPLVHHGRVYTFRIIDFRDAGRTLVVSRRALLEEEQQARAAEVRRALAVGAVVTGRVAAVRDFGAFIDIGGGVQGLVHVSEMGWSRVANPAEILEKGQEVTVSVLRIDETSGQIALSLKALLADPWSKVAATYAVGQIRDGRITRLAEFGAFVELEPGIEALAHASTFAPSGRPGGWSKTVQIGMDVPVEVLGIDPDKRRLSVGLVDQLSARAAASAAAREEAEDVRTYTRREAEHAQGFGGSLADKLKGALQK